MTLPLSWLLVWEMSSLILALSLAYIAASSRS